MQIVPCNSLLRMAGTSHKSNDAGMTLLELLIAVMMLVTFTGVVIMVMEFTLGFLRDVGKASGNGVLIDHIEAQLRMDELVEVLSQPGIRKDEIKNMVAKCTDKPADEWRGMDNQLLPIPNIYPPPGYKFCLRETSQIEDNLNDLLSSGQPGIYMLQALPVGSVDPSRLPVRRLFCRPRPFC